MFDYTDGSKRIYTTTLRFDRIDRHYDVFHASHDSSDTAEKVVRHSFFADDIILVVTHP